MVEEGAGVDVGGFDAVAVEVENEWVSVVGISLKKKNNKKISFNEFPVGANR